MQNPIVSRTSFTEKLAFTAKPDSSTRRRLSAAGFRWNGVSWWRNQNQTVLLEPEQLAGLLAPAQAQAEAATA